MTLFEMKEKLYTIQQERKSVADWLAEKATDPSIAMDAINEKQKRLEELNQRIGIMEKAVADEEAAQKAKLAAQMGGGPGTGMSEKDAMTHKKAAFYRAVLTGGDVKKAYEGLGAIPAGNADLGSGDHLLPKNVAAELLTEPLDENSLRRVEPVSNITGLEEHKLLFTIDDDDLADVTDQETAKEIEMNGDTIAYGRCKTKIFCTIKDTVLHGSDHDLVSAVENALRSGLAVKEKMRAFAPASGGGAYDAAHKHMSFYEQDDSGNTLIKTVERSNIIDAIIDAWADLPDMFSGNASVIMRKTDYYAAIRELNGANNDLFGKKPEDVLGIPVIFNDRAVTPVVGDFRYSKQNYDINTTFETDKDGKKGEYYFILTAWGDHRIKLHSAFRLAKVKAGE
ncbi:MAG: phage major capsid protein [Elusimicrobiales bacterium]|nr:phage major capsid protein [Elusimicrobiales bacterium]